MTPTPFTPPLLSFALLKCNMLADFFFFLEEVLPVTMPFGNLLLTMVLTCGEGEGSTWRLALPCYSSVQLHLNFPEVVLVWKAELCVWGKTIALCVFCLWKGKQVLVEGWGYIMQSHQGLVSPIELCAFIMVKITSKMQLMLVYCRPWHDVVNCLC